MKVFRSLALFVFLSFCIQVIHSQSIPTIAPVRLTFTTIDVPGAGFTYVSGINAAGNMVGIYGISNNGSYGNGFLFSNGTFSYFDYPGAMVTYASGINDSGVIVGTTRAADWIDHGFLYDGLAYTKFDMPGQPETAGLGINNAGDIVGAAGDFSAQVQAFEMQKGHSKRIDLPNHALFEEAVGINNLGDVAAIALDGIDRYGFVYRNSKFKTFNFPGTHAVTAVSAINDHGVVVGSYFVYGAGFYGFAYKNGKYVSFGFPGATETYVTGINTSGQMVGAYVLPDSTEHGFVTSPITDADFSY